MAKQVKVQMEDVDRITNMPDDMLNDIISFLPIEEAVRTSFLSNKWRYRFTFLMNLDFDDLLFCTQESKPLTVKSFTSLVDRVMLFPETIVHKFRLKSGKSLDCCHVYGWICAAIWRRVQHLDLDIPHTRFHTLPVILFSYSSLVTLKVHFQHFVFDVPKGVSLPNLKTLHLISVLFSNENSVQNLLSRCPALEDMVLRFCYLKTRGDFNISHRSLKRLTLCSHQASIFYCCVTIDAPELAYLYYQGFDVLKFASKNLQSIKEADIDIFNVNYFKVEETTAFFKAISNVCSLILSSTSLELLLTLKPYPVFAAMVELKIGSFSWSNFTYYDWDEALETLMSNSPELEQLDFPEQIVGSLPQRVPPCLLFKLKEVEISNFRYNQDCIGKAMYILKNGGALKKLNIRTTSYVSEEKKMEISKVLSNSPKESKQCRILII